MKNIIFILALLLTFTSHAFSQSVMNYQAGTSIEVQTGADICADQVDINGTFSGGGTVCGSVAFILNLSAYIQGFYDASTNTMIPDTVVIYLRNSVTPFAKIDSAKSVLGSSGTGVFLFYNISNSTNYFLSLRHRSSMETWSSSAVPFSTGTLNYDFSSAANKAYGSNQIEVDNAPLKFAVYSGDVNQDGAINLNDMVNVNNDGIIFLSGYVPTDVNGDGFVTLADLIYASNNSNLFISVKKP